ncbi:FTR1 family iron permease [Halomonas sp. 25-S5]|uniref:FTR1 family iron permease n=1 Tax=Halomonas sp. 25-S5 TaxID=2994065 RepID=UPI002468EC15|nr:FTR1 family iron permease [Halomonas sp. 25-S5]
MPLASRSTLTLFVTILMWLSSGLASADVPWLSAETMRSDAARLGRLLYRAPSAERDAAIDARLARLHATWDAGPEAAYQDTAEPVTTALEALDTAARCGDAEEAARARELLWTRLLNGAQRHAFRALEQGDADTATEWLNIREYARASGDTAAELAMAELLAGRLEASEALPIVRRELLGIHAAELRLSLARAAEDAKANHRIQLAGELGRAEGLMTILRESLEDKLGVEATQRLEADLAAAREARSAAAIEPLRAALANYAPVSLSDAERLRRARLLRRFLDLVWIEYQDGVRNGEISIPMEYHEALLFRGRAAMIFGDLRPTLAEAAPDAAERLADILSEMGTHMAAKGDPERIRGLTNEALTLIDRTFGAETAQGGYELAIETLPAVLDEMLLMARSGDWEEAEMKRLEAYSWFDPDIEQRLIPRAPGQALRLEAHFWEGSAALPGLGQIIASEGPVDALADQVAAIEAGLGDARKRIETPLSALGALVQSSGIILREGLEAVLILAALMGALRAEGVPSRAWRRPVIAGVALAVAGSFALWFAARQLITISTLQRELLEGVTALIAAAVLIWVTQTLLSRARGGHLERLRSTLRQSGLSVTSIFVLAFFVVFREGFETVLFYEALLVDAPSGSVFTGLALGGAVALFVGWLVFGLGLRLPLKPFFRITGVLLALLSVMLVGVGVRGLQTAALLPATPVSWFPDREGLQLWLGLFPIAEALAAQGAVIALYLGNLLLGYRTVAPAKT